MKNTVTESLVETQRLTPTLIDDVFPEVEEPATSEVQRGIDIKFLWVPSEIAREKRPGLDWTVKILIALSGMGARKPAGYKGLLATDQELADFLQLSSPRQVQKVIQRGINAGLLARQGVKQRYLCGHTPDKCTTGIKIGHDVLIHPTLSWMQKALYCLIASIAKGKQRQCFASNAWLGNALGMSEGYVREMIAELVKNGCLLSKCDKRRRVLNVTGILPSPTVMGDQVIDIALEPHPDSPGAAPFMGINSPVAAPIRFYNIKDSKEISLASPEKFFLEQTVKSEWCLTDIDPTSIANGVEKSVNTQHRDSIAQPINTITPRWNPATDFEWQYKQFTSTIKGMYLQMQISQLISRRRGLIIDDAILRDFCIQSLSGKIIQIDESCGRLLFTGEAIEFLQFLSLSWYGIKILMNETGKYNVWLITKNTNNVSKFIKRYPTIRNKLKKQTDCMKAVDSITRPVIEGIFFNWLRHGWSTRWNPTGNLLFADIPDEILDYKRLEHAREKFTYNAQALLTAHRANREKPVPDLLSEGINVSWASHFAWIMLHERGLNDHADQYEIAAIDAFKVQPEILEVYRERMPEVMRRIKERIVKRN